MTNCGHNYCERCLVLASGGRRFWKCPQSREPQNIAVKFLPRNFLIERMVEKFQNQESFEITFEF